MRCRTFDISPPATAEDARQTLARIDAVRRIAINNGAPYPDESELIQACMERIQDDA